MSGDPHGWNSKQEYFNAHFGCMEQLRRYFVETDDLAIEALASGLIRIRGRITCKHNLFVDVYKLLEHNQFDEVRTAKYEYHAGVIGEAGRPIFRYDNAHEHTSAGHQDRHHKHVFDPRTWKEITPPIWVGYAGWPTLKQAVDELYDWWMNTGQYLGLNDSNSTPQSEAESKP